MSDIVIKVENVSKLYRLGEVGTGTISHDLNRWWANLRGKEDPFAKVGTVNDRSQKAAKGEHVWALRDINFEVRKGEVLGIIGKNGAGKSTLLKLLSRVTAPTKGEIKAKGRIASLLEVGTGFNPEMTGRENIYMNGTILGMRRKEITAKLDEIVDFAGVAKYLDTPTKRYSSGMTVRLGFAIAAFLEPEILIVDEVLAVGDAEFQKKAIGKMQDVSKGGGRTVLFVSHNMGSVRVLTQKSILLTNGFITMEGMTNDVVDYYVELAVERVKKFDYESHFDESKPVQFVNTSLLNSKNNDTSIIHSGESIKIVFEIINRTNKNFENCSVGIGFFTLTDHLLIALKNDLLQRYYTIKPGLNTIICEIDKFPLSNGVYKYNIIVNNSSEVFDWIKEAGAFEVETGLFFSNGKVPAAKTPSVLVEQKWI